MKSLTGRHPAGTAPGGPENLDSPAGTHRSRSPRELLDLPVMIRIGAGSAVRTHAYVHRPEIQACPAAWAPDPAPHPQESHHKGGGGKEQTEEQLPGKSTLLHSRKSICAATKASQAQGQQYIACTPDLLRIPEHDLTPCQMFTAVFFRFPCHLRPPEMPAGRIIPVRSAGAGSP